MVCKVADFGLAVQLEEDGGCYHGDGRVRFAFLSTDECHKSLWHSNKLPVYNGAYLKN